MSDHPVLIGQFPAFRDFCEDSNCYLSNKNPNKKALSKELRKVLADKNSFHDIRKKAFKLAEMSCKTVGEAFAVRDQNEFFETELAKGHGHRLKAAALHYFLLAEFPGNGKRLNKTIFGEEEIKRVFEYERTKTTPDPPIDSPPPQPTAPFKWPPHVSKEDAFDNDAHEGVWLNPHNHYSIPLSSRDREKELLDEFVNHNRHFLIGALIAPSGAGKTRLISEWMRAYMAKYQDNGWDAGFVAIRDEDPWLEENWTPTRNTLIIIDYTYNYDRVMGVIIDRFKDRAPRKIRMLVLDHVLPDKLYRDFAWQDWFKDQSILDSEKSLFFKPFPIELKPEKDRSILLRDVIACSADPYTDAKRFNRDTEIVVKAANALMTIGKVDKEAPTAEDIRRRDSVRHPLFAALIGQTLYQDDQQDFSGWSRRDLITHYFDRERRIPWDESKQNKYAKTLGPWVGCYVCAATLLRGVAARDMRKQLPKSVRERLSRKNQFQPLVQYCNRIVSADELDVIKPFEPDILGETFFLKFMERFDSNDEVLGAFVAMLSTFKSPDREEKAAISFLETLQRLVRNLINDNHEIEAVGAAWLALTSFLEPGTFTKHGLMRQAVSIALGDAIKQLRAAGLDNLVADIADDVDVADLCNASSGPLWLQSATAFVHYFDWIAAEDRINEQYTEALAHILTNFKARTKEDCSSALKLAAFEGCLGTVKSAQQLLGESVNSSSEKEMTALAVATIAGHVPIVNWLISQGADPCVITTEDGRTALMAASAFNFFDLADCLIQAGANIDQGTNDFGLTALMFASEAGNLDIVDRLIQAGANVGQGTKESDMTPLMFASYGGHLKVVNRLIQAGAAVDQRKTDDNSTALLFASYGGNLGIVDRLIQAGAAINQRRTTDGGTALKIASSLGHLDVVDHLLCAGAAVDQGALDDTGTALMSASQAGHAHVVDRLIQAGAIVARTTEGFCTTALQVASQQGHLDVVDCLIRAGAAVDHGNMEDGSTALMLASQGGHSDVVDRLIQAGAAVNQGKIDDGSTALLAASQNGHLGVVDCLIGAGAIVDQANTENGVTALMVAGQNGHIDVVRRLTCAGASVDQGTTNDGWTALMSASLVGHLNVIGHLIGAGATVDQKKTDDGATALMVASREGHLAIVDCLLRAGATVDHKTTDAGWSALMLASQAGHPDVVDRLIGAGAAVNEAMPDDGETALILASREGHLDVVDRLIAAGANIDQPDTEKGLTALMVASFAGHVGVVDRFIAAGASVNLATTGIGWTALMVASFAGHVDVVDRFIAAGASVDLATTDRGCTALMYARLNGHHRIVDRLIEAGATVGLEDED